MDKWTNSLGQAVNKKGRTPFAISDAYDCCFTYFFFQISPCFFTALRQTKVYLFVFDSIFVPFDKTRSNSKC
ncbi:MAG: hypothetical protein LBV69_06405 [Bacteroidales bacterium]|jgi:hypothetical protein|nr:hypothetical protein [Bacteroidales bacterium]